MLEIEKIAAKKFVEIKGMEYLDIDKYTMTKNVTDIKESNEMKFEFMIAKARHKEGCNIIVDESIPWDETFLLYVNKTTGECRIA